MTLSDKDVLNVLSSCFVCGFRNISDQKYAGQSGNHPVKGAAVVTTNGAGPHNMQIFILSPDGVVLHCLPGFWTPEDLLEEMKLGIQLENEVWKRGNLTREYKDRMFARYHLAHLGTHSRQMSERSQLQGFDAWHESSRSGSDFAIGPQDFRLPMHHSHPSDGGPALKTVDEVMHERMAKQPFKTYEDFDVAKYVEYGELRYDKEEDKRAGQEALHGVVRVGAKPATK